MGRALKTRGSLVACRTLLGEIFRCFANVRIFVFFPPVGNSLGQLPVKQVAELQQTSVLPIVTKVQGTLRHAFEVGEDELSIHCEYGFSPLNYLVGSRGLTREFDC